MTEIHAFVGRAAFAVTVALALAAMWSAVDGRRSHGTRDHRFAVDRLLLLNIAVVVANVAAGTLLAVGGARPADPLHLLYGVAAIVALPLGWILGGRPARDRRPSRARRDAGVLAAGLVLLGIEARLLATG